MTHKSTPVLGCACKYTPMELFAAFGTQAVLMDGEENNFEIAETLTHANLCCHAKALIQQAKHYDEIILTDCCDSIRRAFDVLDYENDHTYLEIMDLPHETSECSIEHLAAELKAMAHAYEQHSGTTFDIATFLDACRNTHQQQHEPARMSESFFATLGARVSPELLETIQDNLALPVLNLTCSGIRNLEEPPEEAYNWDFDRIMDWYAGALLRMVPCMRMANVTNRRQLSENEHLKGIVYNTVKFCDFYGFDYDALSEEGSTPLLKIESDYMPMPQGQLSTRLEAFAESIGIQPDRKESPAMTSSASSSTHNGTYVAGIDSGSTTTNMVVLNRDGSVASSAIVRTGAKAQNGAQAALAAVCQQLNIDENAIDVIMATGYGRFNIPFATDTKTEITCHAKGAHHLNPEIRSIVDIGGQDSKVIVLNEDGSVKNFIMNDKCAAGTGRFLEAMARMLEIDLPTMSTTGLTWDKDLTISSMCTVFAESEVISLIADNHSDADIVHGLNKSIASRTASMVKRAKGEGPFMMTGGVARNQGVVEELERKLDASLFIVENPDLCGALGAALFALEE